jgi:hypothetical protein
MPDTLAHGSLLLRVAVKSAVSVAGQGAPALVGVKTVCPVGRGVLTPRVRRRPVAAAEAVGAAIAHQ